MASCPFMAARDNAGWLILLAESRPGLGSTIPRVSYRLTSSRRPCSAAERK